MNSTIGFTEKRVFRVKVSDTYGVLKRYSQKLKHLYFFKVKCPTLFCSRATIIRIKKGDTLSVSPFLYFSFLYFSFLSFSLPGQNSFQLSEISFGYPIVQEQLPENYSYNPFFLTARTPIFNKKKRTLSFYAEPQLAITNPPSEFKTAFEFGLNLGLKYTFFETEKGSLAAAIGAGPHYLSLETSLQRKGFLFSDNIELAYYQLLNQRTGIHLKTRFRHLSNANLQKPNLGIDNLFVMIGVFWKTK